MNFRLIFSMLLMVLVIIFMLQNAAIVEIKFLIWEGSLPRSFLIFITFLTGMVVVGWLVRAMYRLSKVTTVKK